MALTKEELTAALANPEAADYKLVFDTLKEKEFNVIPKTEFDTFLNTHRQSIEKKIADDKTSEIYTNIDKDLFEVAGVKRPPEKKTYEVIKETLKDYKEKLAALNAENEDYKKKIAEGSQDKTLTTRIEALEKQKADLEKAIQEKDSLVFQKDVNGRLLAAKQTLPAFKKEIPASVIDSYWNTLKTQLITGAKVENGRYVYHDKDGKPILDDKAQIASEEYILKEMLKDVLDQGRQQTGTGSGQSAAGQNAFTRWTNLPPGIERKGDLIDAMSKAGYIKYSKEYNEDFAKFSEGLKLR